MYLNIFLIINGMYLHIIIWTKKNIFFRNNEDSNEQKRVSINALTYTKRHKCKFRNSNLD